MSHILHWRWLVAVGCLLAGLPNVAQAEVYYVQPLAELKLVEGELPETDVNYNYRYWWRRGLMLPYVVIDGEGQGYVTPMSESFNSSVPDGEARNVPSVAIQTSKKREITGKLFLPKGDYSGMATVKFSITADEGQEDQREQFLKTKWRHYELLLSRNTSGAAWFRHQVRDTRKQLGISDNECAVAQPQFFPWRSRELDDTYALVSGGRAVSENLQLERMLPEAAPEEPTVALDSITGITVKPFDWDVLNKDARPKRDPLARLIPDDQYAIFLPSFQAMVDLADNAGEQGALALRAADTRAEDVRVRERYERQLGIGLNEFARRLGPALIDSVALTGADPYLRTGADLAVVFQAKDANALVKFVEAQVAISAGSNPAAKPVEGDIEGVRYTGYRSPDRAVCSYVAKLEDAVVVANSPVQLERLIRVSKGQSPSIDSLGEYTFFRNRYPLGDAAETGLLVLSDNTIRKWCSPRWRIATSRRTRAVALMAEMQSAHLDRLVKGDVTPGPLHTAFQLPDAGDFTLGPEGVQSSRYGTLEFQTPIVELEFDKVTTSEAEFYKRWLQGYERNFSNFFDPIAVRFTADAEKLAADLTVMPLIDFSDYRSLVSVSRGAVIKPQSGDPHPESLAHAVLSINTDSPLVKQGANFARNMAQLDPLSWLGESVAVYADADPLWQDFAKLEDEKAMSEFMEKNAFALPIGLNLEVKSGVKLIVFLAGLRTFIEQASPGMLVWETLTHNDQSYVKISPSERARSGAPWDQAALYYVASGDALVVTLNEDVLKRAIDRQLQRKKRADAGEAPVAARLPWLGENFCVTIDGKLMKLLGAGLSVYYHDHMQRLSWGNLAILNEWHARYPGEDPVALHQRFWQQRLICPGGGEYRWNDQWQTMESTVYGHPGEPKVGSSLPTFLQAIESGNFGQTFEENGLRARVELTRTPPTAKE